VLVDCEMSLEALDSTVKAVKLLDETEKRGGSVTRGTEVLITRLQAYTGDVHDGEDSTGDAHRIHRGKSYCAC